MDTHTQRVLQEILRRESRSVLIYVGEAYPWTRWTDEKALADLQEIIATEREAVASLGRFLVRKHVSLPYLVSYPAHFTTINFLALNFLLPRLIEYERQSITDLERDRAELTDLIAQAEVDKLLALKRRHLPRLEELASTQPQASVT